MCLVKNPTERNLIFVYPGKLPRLFLLSARLVGLTMTIACRLGFVHTRFEHGQLDDLELSFFADIRRHVAYTWAWPMFKL